MKDADVERYWHDVHQARRARQQHAIDNAVRVARRRDLVGGAVYVAVFFLAVIFMLAAVFG